nr:myosin-J heavy chain-like isoform X1 [Tanacetum cinerariifolium]
MESPNWTEINAGIQQHLQKAYNTNKAAFKAQHWVIDRTTRSYNVKKIRRERPENITASEWDKYIEFWNNPRNIARPAQNRKNRAKSTVISRQGSRSLARLRDEMEEMRRSEAMGTYTDDEINRLARGGKHRGHIVGVGRVLPTRATASPSMLAHDSMLNSLYKKEEMMRLEAMGTYTDDEINRLARGGKQRGHIAGVDRVLPARAIASPSMPAHDSTLNSLHKKVDFMMSIFKSDSKYSNMFSQFESGGASGSGGCGDEEEGADHQDDEDEDGDDDA